MTMSLCLSLPGCSALSEMQSVLLSVAKERKAQRKQTAFVDALLQSSLTERQVNTNNVTDSSLKPQRQLKGRHTAQKMY